MKIHILLLGLLGTTAGIMYAAQVAVPAPQLGFFQQYTDAVRQEIAQMIPNDDDLDKLLRAYPDDPILLQEQNNRLDLLKYWTRPNIRSRSKFLYPGYSPAFSPDGNYLAYLSIVGNETRLALLSVTSGHVMPITSELKNVTNFAFSPDPNIMAVIGFWLCEIMESENKSSYSSILWRPFTSNFA